MKDILKSIDEAMSLLPERMDSKEARAMLLVIGLQESRLIHRRQLVGNPPRPTGPATGLWQFERGGGVVGVLQHNATRTHARTLCNARNVKPEPQAVWQALQYDDVLAAGFARLLLWSDPRSLPEIGNKQAAWDLYIHTWRPGKPKPKVWDALYDQALDILTDRRC